MSLIICPECKKEVSNMAKICPNCGFPINEKDKDKKIYEYYVVAINVYPIVQLKNSTHL